VGAAFLIDHGGPEHVQSALSPHGSQKGSPTRQSARVIRETEELAADALGAKGEFVTAGFTRDGACICLACGAGNVVGLIPAQSHMAWVGSGAGNEDSHKTGAFFPSAGEGGKPCSMGTEATRRIPRMARSSDLALREISQVGGLVRFNVSGCAKALNRPLRAYVPVRGLDERPCWVEFIGAPDEAAGYPSLFHVTLADGGLPDLARVLQYLNRPLARRQGSGDAANASGQIDEEPADNWLVTVYAVAGRHSVPVEKVARMIQSMTRGRCVAAKSEYPEVVKAAREVGFEGPLWQCAFAWIAKNAQDHSVVTDGQYDTTKADASVAASIRGISRGLAGFMGGSAS
jgi:hypothetical protein